MSSETLKAKGLGILVLCSVMIAVVCLFYTGVVKVTPVHDDMAPEPIYTARMTVDIVNAVDGLSYPAYGVGVEYQGQVFIVTSRLLLHAGIGVLTVNGQPASIIGEDIDAQLVALTTDIEIPVSDLTESEWGPLTMVVTDVAKAVTTNGKIHEWTIIQDAPGKSTGAAVYSGDDLIGVIIGANSKNPTEAIVAGNGLLIRFAKALTNALTST